MKWEYWESAEYKHLKKYNPGKLERVKKQQEIWSQKIDKLFKYPYNVLYIPEHEIITTLAGGVEHILHEYFLVDRSDLKFNLTSFECLTIFIGERKKLDYKYGSDFITIPYSDLIHGKNIKILSFETEDEAKLLLEMENEK